MNVANSGSFSSLNDFLKKGQSNNFGIAIESFEDGDLNSFIFNIIWGHFQGQKVKFPNFDNFGPFYESQ